MNLDAVISSIQETISQIQASGEVAQRGTVIEVVPHSKTRKQYARKRCGKRFEGCGRAGSIQHREAIKSIQRSKVLDELIAVSNKLKALKESQDWQAIANAAETIEIDPLLEAPPIEKKPKCHSLPIKYVLRDAKGATSINRKVHAISSEEPGYGRWYAPALCGENPKADSWGWRRVDSSELSCPKCHNKLKLLA